MKQLSFLHEADVQSALDTLLVNEIEHRAADMFAEEIENVGIELHTGDHEKTRLGVDK